MRLMILLPTEVLVDERVTRIIAEAENGSFCLEPRHIDFVAALVPGLLSYVTETDEEVYVGIDEGTLVKCGPEVMVSTRAAVRGTDPAELKEAIQRLFLDLDDHERRARTALSRLEAGVVRRFVELEKGL